MDFEPFDESYRFDPNIFIEDFPDYLIDKVRHWMLTTLRYHGVITGNSVNSNIREALELRLRTTLPHNSGSLINYFTDTTEKTRNMLTMILQNFTYPDEAESLKALLRGSSSAYTVEEIDSTEDQDEKYTLVYRISDAERRQAESALNASELMRQAYISCYKIDPDYPEAVRRANDYLEGLLKKKFWPERARTLSVGRALEKFQSEPDLLKFKADSFVTDKSKVIGLLEGIANIREEHTTGTGRPPTSDEAEFVVQTVIYLHNLLEPIEPITPEHSQN